MIYKQYVKGKGKFTKENHLGAPIAKDVCIYLYINIKHIFIYKYKTKKKRGKSVGPHISVTRNKRSKFQL